MASAKRHLEEEEVVAKPKKAKESVTSPRVLLNPADCDLDFNIECNGLVGYGLHEQGFAYCWSGARATVGITRGRYCFGCKVVSVQPVDMDDTAPDQRHLCRLGISRGDDVVGSLGESKHSFGYGGTGKFSNAGRFLNYTDRFGAGDTIVCCIDLESKPLATIGFSKNGKWLGTAFQFDAGSLGLGVGGFLLSNLQWKSALFPHVLLKNVVVQMQFSVEDGLIPQEGFKPWALVGEDGNVVMGPTFSDPRDCEVIMMVGLPASGKTTWAEKWVNDHPEKRYVLLGTNLILDQMKVPGLLRKNNYGERFDRLMDRATGIFNIMLFRAARIPGNYIIDQTNVYKNARKRKLKPFADYQKIAVVIFPKPEELKIRSDKRFKEMGKEVPPDAVNNMIANYVLPKSKDMPHSDEYFDKVVFVELNPDESQKYLDQMKQDVASLSNNNSSTLSRGDSLQSSAGSALQNQGSLTGSGIHLQGSYSSISPSNYGMPSQVNVDGHMNELHGSMNSLSGLYPRSQIPHVTRAPSPYGSYSKNQSSYFPRGNACQKAPSPYGSYSNNKSPSPYGSYSNNESSYFPRDNAGHKQTYGVIPMGDTEACSSSLVDGQYRSNIVGNNMVFHGAFPDPYRSGGTNEPSPIASVRTMPFGYSTHSRPYNDNSGFWPDLHTPTPTTYSLSQYDTPTPRPPYEGLPNEMLYPGRYAYQHPRYS